MAILFSNKLTNVQANLVGETVVNYQDYANNKTNVTSTLSVVSNGEWFNGVSTNYFNGTQYKPYINVPQWGRQVIATQTYDVYHNDKGEGTVTISGSCNIAVGRFQASGSGSMNLPTIPRASQPSLVTYPNTTYNITLGDKIYIHFNRKSESFTHTVQLLFGGYNPYLVSSPIDGGNYLWDTSKNAPEMYEKMKTVNKKEGIIRLYTYSGNNLIGQNDVKFSANITDANPMFTNFDYEIVDSKSINLTGNNKHAIKSISTVNVIIDETNEAVPQKGAYIEKYKFVCGNNQVETSSLSKINLQIDKVDNITMQVYAIDSRGNSTLVNKPFDKFINYEPISYNKFDMIRTNGTSRESTMNYEGKYWNENFGVVTNSIKNAVYKYKETDNSEWVTGETDIIPTITNNLFSFSSLVKGDLDALGFTLNNSFDVKIELTDEISTYEISTILNTGTPNIAIAKNGIAIGQKYDENIGGKIQGIYEVGDIFISTTTKNPKERFGGEWEFFGEGKTLVGVDPNDTLFNTVKKTGGAKEIKLTTDQIPSHYHQMYRKGRMLYWDAGLSGVGGATSGSTIQATWDSRTNNAGGGKAHSNIQPYITVYFWIRTA